MSGLGDSAPHSKPRGCHVEHPDWFVVGGAVPLCKFRLIIDRYVVALHSLRV
jgi:hypothetical protein